MTSKCGKNKKVANEAQSSVSLMFLPHFDFLCDILLNSRTATWNLFVLYNKELKYTEKSLFISNFATFWDTKIALWRDLLPVQNEANKSISDNFCLLNSLNSKQSNGSLPWNNFTNHFVFRLVAFDCDCWSSFVKSFSKEKRVFLFFLQFIVTVHGLGKAFF